MNHSATHQIPAITNLPADSRATGISSRTASRQPPRNTIASRAAQGTPTRAQMRTIRPIARRPSGSADSGSTILCTMSPATSTTGTMRRGNSAKTAATGQETAPAAAPPAIRNQAKTSTAQDVFMENDSTTTSVATAALTGRSTAQVAASTSRQTTIRVRGYEPCPRANVSPLFAMTG